MTNENQALRPGVDLKKLKFIFLWVFAFGLVAHGFCYFNGNFSHDSLRSIYEPGPYAMIAAGRYCRAIYRLIRGNFTLPVINGFLFLVFLSLAVYLLTDLLPIRKKVLLILACGILTVNSTVSLMNATYLHDADAYGFALLMAVLGAWVAVKLPWGALLSIPFYTVSLGIYQAYINVIIYLWLFLALMELLKGTRVRQVYAMTFLRMLSIAGGMVLYFVGHLVVLWVTGIDEDQGYNTVTVVAQMGLAGLLQQLRVTLEAGLSWFLQPRGNSPGMIRLLNILLIPVLAYSLVVLGKRNHVRPAGWLGILGILAAIPLGMNATVLLSGSYHHITIYASFFTYLAAIVLAEQCLQLPNPARSARAVQLGCSILLGILVFDSCLYSNTIYLKKELESQQTLSVFTRIINQMEQTDGYVLGETPIVLVGATTESPLNVKREGFDYGATGLWCSLTPTYYPIPQTYISYYLGYPAVFGDGVDQWRVSVSEEMLEMPLFPEPGSVRMIDGIMVVKLSHPIIPAS